MCSGFMQSSECAKAESCADAGWNRTLSGGDMKRTATTLVLLAGFGGGCVSPTAQTQKAQPSSGGFGTVTRGKEVGTLQGPLGEPIMAARGMMPSGAPSGVVQAGGMYSVVGDPLLIRPAAGMSPGQVSAGDGCTSCFVPGVGGNVVRDSMGYGYVMPAGGYGPPPGAYGPPPGTYGQQIPKMPKQGILPVPTMGPPGAVAAVGALPGGMMRPVMANGRSSINFTGPAGMKVTWQLPDGSFNDERMALTAPKEYNFLQGQVYRLRLTQILPDFPGRSFYPTLEVSPANPKTLTFLAHSSIPITFSADDFAQARAGNLVVKVVYLPDPVNQDFSTIVGAEEVVSTRLEPGADPVAEAQRRGTILAIIRMGNIDLENRISPTMTAPPPGAILPPGAVPPGMPLPAPKPTPKTGLNALPPLSPVGPMNPPGSASVNPPVMLPQPPVGPTDLPPAPIGAVPPAVPTPKSFK